MCCGAECDCETCDSLTAVAFTTSGGGHCATCSYMDGTYVFRSVGDPFDTPTAPNYYCDNATLIGQIEDTTDCDPFIKALFCLEVTGIGLWFELGCENGLYFFNAVVRMVYNTPPSATSATKVLTTFRKTSSSCASLAGTIPFFSNDISHCNGAAYGDECDIANATVVLS